MKRSPASSLSVSVSSSSSNSSADESVKIKRPRKNHNNGAVGAPNNSSRRSSIYRGVTRHRWTGRFEAHLWDKTSWNNIQNKKGRQVYLGAYDCEEAAARTYDLAALKYWGPDTTLNFPIETYKKEREEMHKVSKEEYLASLRRQSSGFSRGVSKYRGVARHHHNGRWEARIGRVLGNKYLYLGTYNTQEEAAAAYDMAAIEYRGANAVTNFDISNYIERLKQKGISIIPSSSSARDQEVEVEQPPPLPQQEIEQQSPSPPLQREVEQQLSSPPRPKQLSPKREEIDCSVKTEQYPEAVEMVPPPELYEQEEELTWNFYLDAGLTQFSVADHIPFGNNNNNANAFELPNVFDFADNIDFIFDEEQCASEYKQGAGVGVPANTTTDINGGSSSSSSSPSSSSSTTTSVSCNY